MTEPLLAILRDPAPLVLYDPTPLSLSDVLVGNAVYLIYGGLAALAMLCLPLLRGMGVVVMATRWLARAVTLGFAPGQAIADPERALDLAGLSPSVARLAQQTRTLALELRRRSEEARHWPEDGGEPELVGMRWWSSLISDPVDIRPILETRREVFDWLDSIAVLPASDRAWLGELGVDVEAVRSVLTADRPVADGVRQLAGLLWSIDERLAAAGAQGYRSSNAEVRAGSLRPGRLVEIDHDDDQADDDLARRRRFAELIASEGRGLSRLAASYAKTRAEREDLEQDILLALWQALPRYRGEASVETFAYRVARYCCYRQVRRRARHACENAEVELAALADAACVEASLLRADELDTLDQARASLPDTLAAPLSLHLSGLSYAEIARRLGISE
ncbi:MAG TPA: sigma-70 family RNA polymerase sigma factor, partial [Enhygromyxa sp.]|nr:sigma-70 family RNA polymerase sigma factor [Enhygromyxa sp.]